jgi:hypothetical protein
VVQCVEGFRAHLHLHRLRHRKLALQREIQRLSAWSINSVPAGVAERERRRAWRRPPY